MRMIHDWPLPTGWNLGQIAHASPRGRTPAPARWTRHVPGTTPSDGGSSHDPHLFRTHRQRDRGNPRLDRHPGEEPSSTFNEADFEILVRYWYPVAYSDEVTEGPLGATLLDQRLVIYRVDGEVTVARDLCTHRGMMLSLGKDQHDGRGIKCPYHGLRFGTDGRCTAIPAHPNNRIPERMHLKSYGAVERYGLVWTCLAASPGDEPQIPPVPHWGDPGFQRINCPGIDIDAFAGRQVEGFLDVAHFPFVHDNSFAFADNTEVPEYRPVPTADGFEAAYWSTMPNIPHTVPEALEAVPEGFMWLRHFRLHVPFTAILVVHFPEGGVMSMMNAVCPVSARKSRLFDARCRNFDTEQPLQEIYAFNRRIFEEDRTMGGPETGEPATGSRTRGPHPGGPLLHRLPPGAAGHRTLRVLHRIRKTRRMT